MAVVYFLIGVPGSGKTTWRESYLKKHSTENVVIISTDDMIEHYAKENGLTYTEAFKIAPLKKFEEIAFQMTKNAINNKDTIIIDRTNMGKNIRAKFLSYFPNEYKKIAIIFSISRDELDKRLAKREKETNKVIGKNIIDSMLLSYMPPSLDEGFDQIIKKYA